MIDLIELYSNRVSKISLDNIYEIPKSKINVKDIHDLSKIELKDSYIENIDGELYIKAKIIGKMLISDSITLEDVWYSFNIEIDEKLNEFVEKDENSLDIIEFLWQNIVLEVPLRYSEVKNYDKYQGDGWKLVSEEELVNNPFSTLLKNEDRSD